MKLGHYHVIILTLLVSTTYLFGIDYYDKKSTQIETLYKQVALEGITYHPITIALQGSEKEEQSIESLAIKQGEVVSQLSHAPNCSKLCRQMHLSHTDTEFTQEDRAIGVTIINKDPGASYTASIKAQKDIHYNTYYKISIKGLEDLVQLDNLRQQSYRLFEKWGVTPKEYIAFTGEIKGFIDQGKKEAYTEQLMQRLQAKPTSYYEEDLTGEVLGCYAYSKDIKTFIRDDKGQKTNLQISFTYNELENITNIIIAFPFYNEPF